MNAPADAFLHDKLQVLHAQADEFIALRRDIHKHPEMGYKEYRTSDLVAEQLSAWGYQVTRGLGGTGLVGQLKKGSGTKSIGIRADMDARYLLISLIGLCLIYSSNRYTLSQSLRLDLGSEAVRETGIRHVTRLLLDGIKARD